MLLSFWTSFEPAVGAGWLLAVSTVLCEETGEGRAGRLKAELMLCWRSLCWPRAAGSAAGAAAGRDRV